MTIDEELFRNFQDGHLPIFRIYSWEKACTIGISQKFEDLKDLEEYQNNWAKRITGGGILLHGNDISYSLVLPTKYTRGLSVKKTYELICAFLLEFYKSIGLDAQFAKDNANINLSKNAFCQIGYEPYDIVINEKKIGGNAQRRTKNVLFQHGSIQLHHISDEEKYGNSLEDFNVNLSIEIAQKKLLEAFRKTFDVRFEQE
jgi:lipoate-protein ligase A